MCLVYFIILDFVFAIYSVFSTFIFFISFGKFNIGDLVEDAFFSRVLGMTRMEIIGYRRMRTISQMLFETLPQIFLQLRIIDSINNNNDDINVSYNALYYSIGFAILHILMEGMILYLDSSACYMTFSEYAIICLNARLNWVPYSHILKHHDTNDSNSSNNGENDLLSNESKHLQQAIQNKKLLNFEDINTQVLCLNYKLDYQFCDTSFERFEQCLSDLQPFAPDLNSLTQFNRDIDHLQLSLLDDSSQGASLLEKQAVYDDDTTHILFAKTKERFHFNNPILSLIRPLLSMTQHSQDIYCLKMGHSVMKHLNLSSLSKLLHTAGHRCLLDVDDANCHKVISNTLQMDVQSLLNLGYKNNVKLSIQKETELDIIFDKLLHFGELNVVNTMLYMIPQFSVSKFDSFNSIYDTVKCNILLNLNHNLLPLKKYYNFGILFGVSCKESNILYSFIYILMKQQMDLIKTNNNAPLIKFYFALLILWYTQRRDFRNHKCFECNRTCLDHLRQIETTQSQLKNANQTNILTRQATYLRSLSDYDITIPDITTHYKYHSKAASTFGDEILQLQAEYVPKQVQLASTTESYVVNNLGEVKWGTILKCGVFNMYVEQLLLNKLVKSNTSITTNHAGTPTFIIDNLVDLVQMLKDVNIEIYLDNPMMVLENISRCRLMMTLDCNEKIVSAIKLESECKNKLLEKLTNEPFSLFTGSRDDEAIKTIDISEYTFENNNSCEEWIVGMKEINVEFTVDRYETISNAKNSEMKSQLSDLDDNLMSQNPNSVIGKCYIEFFIPMKLKNEKTFQDLSKQKISAIWQKYKIIPNSTKQKGSHFIHSKIRLNEAKLIRRSQCKANGKIHLQWKYENNENFDFYNPHHYFSNQYPFYFVLNQPIGVYLTIKLEKGGNNDTVLRISSLKRTANVFVTDNKRVVSGYDLTDNTKSTVGKNDIYIDTMSQIVGHDEELKHSENEQNGNRIRYRNIIKVLLLGVSRSGKSTLVKQLQSIHGDGFDTRYRKTVRSQIYEVLIESMKEMINNCEHWQDAIEDGDEDTEIPHEVKEMIDKTPDVHMLTEDVTDSVDKILSTRNNVEMTEDLCQSMLQLWNHKAIQFSFSFRNIISVPDSTEHFMNSFTRITDPNYIPSDEDVFLARYHTFGMEEKQFDIDGTLFKICDVGGRRNERRKWIHFFDNVTAVLFVASLAAYDDVPFEDEEANLMRESLEIFDEHCNSAVFEQTAFILLLNKNDIFMEKALKKSIAICFGGNYSGNHYKGPEPGQGYPDSELIEAQYEFIKAEYQSKNDKPEERQISVHRMQATDPDNIKRVFNDVQHTVIDWSLATSM